MIGEACFIKRLKTLKSMNKLYESTFYLPKPEESGLKCKTNEETLGKYSKHLSMPKL